MKQSNINTVKAEIINWLSYMFEMRNCESITESILPAVVKDIDETADEKFNDSDIHLAVERTVMSKLESLNESFEERLNRLGNEAFDLAKHKLACLPDKKLILRAPVSMHIDTGNGFIYDLDARTVFLMADSIQVFGDDFDLSRLDEENGWDDLQPDEYWCEGGEWYAEWEGLFCLLDEIINTPAERLVEVDWETDGEDTDLPSQVSVPNNVIEDDDVADWLSDNYGFLVNSWKEV